jgi:hypothetical protein
VRACIAALSALVALTPGCRRPVPSDDGHTVPAEGTAEISPAPSATPVDRLAPDELLSGSEQAFGIVLPRAVTVKGRFVDVVYADASASVHALAQYFRPRLHDGSMREGPAAAAFEHVKVRGQPGLELDVHIVSAPQGASVEIRDATPQPPPALPDEPSRWRQVGLTPNGHLLDPTHLD